MVDEYGETEDSVVEDAGSGERTYNEFIDLSPSEEYEMMRALFSEIRELRNTKQFLDSQSRELKEKVAAYSSELDGIEVVIAATKKEIEQTDQRREDCLESVTSLRDEKEMEIEIINNLQKNIKAVSEDVNKCLTLKEHMAVEFESLTSEKTIIYNKLKDIEAGAKKICGQKNATKVPYLKAYDALFKRIHHAFREAENRMDVSLKLLH